MSKPIFDQPYGLKYQVDGIRMELSWRPDFGAEKTAALQKAQFALAQEAARLIDSYVPFYTGQLKNSVQTASKYDEGLLVYNTPLRPQAVLPPRRGHRPAHLHGQQRTRAGSRQVQGSARLLLGPAGYC